MKSVISIAVRAVAMLALVATVGCARTLKTVHFTPVPKPVVGAQDLAPVKPRAVTELLREADREFQEANKAQEANDYEASLRHYNRMLELLIEADLDPTVFYNLRQEFERILSSSSEQAKLFEQKDRIRKWTEEDYARMPVKGDLEIPFPIPPRVLDEIEEIQSLYPKNFQRGLDRSFRYLPHVRQRFAEAGLPQDLVYLAMVESQYYVKAVSSAGATGMWQFMPATARRYGLRVDSYVDERYNWRKSTEAAVRFLGDLIQQFDGNWPLAVSSYNMGEFGMERAIAMNGNDRNLWRLVEEPPAANHIRLETKKFYPKLLASIMVAKNPDRYGFTVNRQPPDDAIQIPIRGSYSLASIEKASGIEAGVLVEMNPDLIREVTPPEGEYLINAPEAVRQQILAAMQQLPQDGKTVALAKAPKGKGSKAGTAQAKAGTKQRMIVHRVRKGETLARIAEQYNTTVDAIRQANRIRSEKKLMVGQKLQIPGAEAPVPPEEAAPQVAKTETVAPAAASQEAAADDGSTSGSSLQAKKSKSKPGKTYRVKRGDTLFDIAKSTGISVKDLQTWNNMGRGTGLRIGDELKLFPSDTASQATDVKPEPPTASDGGQTEKSPEASSQTVYVVKSGDTPAKIADQYGVKLADLLAWNNLKLDSVIRVGDKLVLQGAALVEVAEKTPESGAKENQPVSTDKKAQPANTEMKVHAVAKGDTISGIAGKYDVKQADLMGWNGLTGGSMLRVGQKLTVYATPNGAVQPEKADVVPSEKKEPAQDAASDSAPAKQIEHTVVAGDNPGQIAKKYKVKLADLMKWNNWDKAPVLQVGSKVLVSPQ